MNVWVLAPEEEWICDRLAREFSEDNSDIVTSDVERADIIWLLADFAWRHVPFDTLRRKRVLTTIHHCVPDKWDALAHHDFLLRDAVTSVYHVPNKHTHDFVRPMTKKPIFIIPYWANASIWKKTGEKHEIREKLGLPSHGFLIGSFQRDTEGSSISLGSFLPKNEKGPDLFADFVVDVYTRWRHKGSNFQNPTPHVVLAGWRRQYLMKRLDDAAVPYTYFEFPSQDALNELYQTLDLYPITSRYEGGPQALIETGLLGIPVVSRPVGIAEQVLPSYAINDNVALALPSVPDVSALKTPMGYEPYRELLKSL